MILASVIFCYWSVAVKWISLDALVWNLLFLIIHVFLSIPLIKQRLPIHLSSEEQQFYDLRMAKFLTKHQFKLLIDNGQFNNVTLHSQIVNEGDYCNKIIMMFNIPSNMRVQLYKGSAKLIPSVSGSWLGTIEYLDTI